MQAALSRIHQCGVVHNAIHSENIMVNRAIGRPPFVDFAVAQLTTSEEAFENEDDELDTMVGHAGFHPIVLHILIAFNPFVVFFSFSAVHLIFCVCSFLHISFFDQGVSIANAACKYLHLICRLHTLHAGRVLHAMCASQLSICSIDDLLHHPSSSARARILHYRLAVSLCLKMSTVQAQLYRSLCKHRASWHGMLALVLCPRQQFERGPIVRQSSLNHFWLRWAMFEICFSSAAFVYLGASCHAKATCKPQALMRMACPRQFLCNILGAGVRPEHLLPANLMKTVLKLQATVHQFISGIRSCLLSETLPRYHTEVYTLIFPCFGTPQAG